VGRKRGAKPAFCKRPGVWKDLDQWMRRAVQLKQWGRGKTIYRELPARGAAPEVGRRVAARQAQRSARVVWKKSQSSKFLFVALI